MTNQSAPQSGSTRFIELGGSFFNIDEIREIRASADQQPDGRFCSTVWIYRKDTSFTHQYLGKDRFKTGQEAMDFAIEIVRNACGTKKGNLE